MSTKHLLTIIIDDGDVQVFLVDKDITAGLARIDVDIAGAGAVSITNEKGETVLAEHYRVAPEKPCPECGSSDGKHTAKCYEWKFYGGEGHA